MVRYVAEERVKRKKTGQRKTQYKMQPLMWNRVLDARLIVAGVVGLGLATGTIGNAPMAKAQSSRVYATDLTDVVAATNGGRVVDSSSTFNDDKSYGATNLIGGKVYNPNDKSSPNGWVSNKYDSVNMESVTFGFADNALKNIGKIVLNPSTAVTPERWAKDIEVQVSTDTAQGPYRAVAQITLERQAKRQEFLILPAPARFVKLVFRSNWGSDRAVALGSVEMYESIPSTDPVGQLITRLEGAVNDLKKFRDAQNEISNATSSGTTPVSTKGPQLLTPLKLVSSASIADYKESGDTSNRTIFTGNNAPIDPSLLQLVAGESSTGTEVAPTAAPTNGRATNIALASNGGKIVDVSSTFNNDPQYSANNLIDGQNFSLGDGKGSFGWASEGFASGQQYVTIGFREDRTHVINKFVLNPVSSQNSLRWASRIEVQVTSGSPTTGPFRTVGTLTLRQEATNQDFTIPPVEAKYVRFVFVANGPGNPLPQGDPNVSSDRAVSLGEIEIYEPAASSGELDSLIGRFNQVLIDLKRMRSQQQIGASAASTGADTSSPADTTTPSTTGSAATDAGTSSTGASSADATMGTTNPTTP